MDFEKDPTMHLQNLFFYGDVIPLGFQPLEQNLPQLLKEFDKDWVQYNSNKPDIRRKGLSITSLDGGMTGIPDLDSVREYNLKHGKTLRESDFNIRTPVAQVSKNLKLVLDGLDPIGRTHLIKLDSGGFFPPHRDGGTKMPAASFRIFATVQHANENEFVWLQEDRQLLFEPQRFYVVNTFKKHSVFSFVNSCTFLVVNVPATKQNIQFMLENMSVK